LDSATFIFEGKSGLCPEKECQVALSNASAPVVIETVHLVLDGAVPDPTDVRDATFAQVVQYAHLFRQSDGVVEGKHYE
jgi:hypothetical protein